MAKNKFNIKHVYLKFFLCIFLLSFYGLYQYNRLEANSFNMEFHEKITKLYDTIRKVTPFYLNTKTVLLPQGTYTIDMVSVIVNQDSKVKRLSSGINLLETEIKRYIGNDYWSIAVLQQSELNANTAHFKPLHEVHLSLNSEFGFDKNGISRILSNENMPTTYQAFTQCDLKLTEPYIEQFSEKKIRSVFYPIYVNKEISAMFVLDVKASMFTHWLETFNEKRNSFLDYSDGSSTSLGSEETIEIPCTPIDGELTLSINVKNILLISAVFSLFMTSLFCLLEIALFRLINYFTIDQMTGLYRRDFHEVKLNRTSGKSVIIVDIDNFKFINDQFGHFKGDLVIKEVCRRLQKNIRRHDLAIRWGGEEFVIVLNNISYEGLINRTEAIRHSIATGTIAGMKVTVSIGATVGNASSFKKALKLADTALYQSKHSGKNRVTVLEGANK
ncbi:GGDEF domain-containing protein [Aliivibrio sifiae]|uniref:diguanylate cyclase n=1 Tax=Aliivibrio sifiae TaxID=566293 RepID=A0A2S7X6M5_9GAMM|nr:GGDEF domain-containing protein [Aliivibrio sifiae]PQJ87008.1 GGDEF domain-containing protein [Aliivibrio sifiae]GLR73861.1 GGDEF domain-containing protein [Aliivibrio sifiae]